MTGTFLFALVGAAVLAAGCASPTINVTGTPVQAQAPTDLATDSLACERRARGAENARAAYAACMITRGYRATVSLPTGSSIGLPGERSIFVEVGKHARSEVAAITADLTQCRRRAIDQHTASPRALTVPTGRYPAEGLPGFPVVRAYAACLEPRGYTVAVWTPDR
ncbi:MAG: hypothetical protein ACREK6_06050 [Candidatus Rokuibacteriota bacterium]